MVLRNASHFWLIVTFYPGDVRIGKLDVDKEKQLAAELKIQSVPTIVAFFEGRPIASFVGVPDEKKYPL